MIGEAFSRLICGVEQCADRLQYVDSDYIGLFDILSREVSSLSENLCRMVVDVRSSNAVVYPYLCRKFLELSATALLARVDPVRVLAARKHQKTPDYSCVERNNSAIQWTGDIFPAGAAPKNIWSNDALKGRPERSLLGWHFKELYFSSGFDWMSDADSLIDSAWIREMSKADGGFEFVKSRLNKLYSKLSKGVHSEYLVEDRVVFDDRSMEVDVCETVMLVGLLSMALNMSPMALRSVNPISAIASLKNIEVVFLKNRGEV